MLQRSVLTDPTLKGNKQPFPHRIRLIDGRVLDGGIFRNPDSRLDDDLFNIKGSFLSVVDVEDTTSGESVAYMAINERHIVSIEEL